MKTLSRLYVIVALVAAGILAPLVYAPVPWLMLLAYLYLEFVGRKAHLKVPYNVILALSLPLLFQPLSGTWLSPLLALPVLPLLGQSLRQLATGEGEGEQKKASQPGRRRPTRLLRLLAVSLLVITAGALALSGWTLLVSIALTAVYLAGIFGLVLKRSSKVPVEAAIVTHRVVAGDFLQVHVRLINRCRLAGHLRLSSPYPWFTIRPARLVVDKPAIELEASLTPPLSGPAVIELAARFTDPWGLIQSDFTLPVMELLVIPRARYAEWMARKYLETSRGGGQESMTAVAASTRRASRRGIEFYGIRPYQPGDSARAIDWKHTSKLHEMIVKEFLDTTVECAVLAVNLSVSDEEEKDRLAFDLITTALTLARENIPSALTAYSQREVVKTTRLLDPRQALVEALGLTREVTISASPRRYLTAPDVDRLRANLNRLRHPSSGRAPGRLVELLQLEYTALVEAARQNPATAALSAALAGLRGKVNILVISARNHDAAALAFNRHVLEKRGYRFLV